MENFQPLTDFYEAIADDARIGATHISLYMALLQEWNTAVAQNPLSVNRDTMMKAARMGRKTYNKCMKELQEYGYIKYEPSSNPLIKSKIYLRNYK